MSRPVSRPGSAPPGGGTVVVHWVRANGRSVDMAAGLDAELVFMPWARPRRPLPHKVVSWARSAVRTVRVVRRRPAWGLVVAVAPPVFVPLVALAARRRTTALAIDVHSSMLNQGAWAWSYPLARWVLRRADVVVVTNREIVAGVGLDPGRLAVAHAAAFLPEPTGPTQPSGPSGPPDPSGPATVVFPASGAFDEPFATVDELAALLDGEARVLVTGLVPPAGGGGGAERTGYLDQPVYDALIRDADVVLALTTREATMQRAGHEALCAGRPLVSADTSVLREALAGAAVFAPATDAAALAAAVREARRRSDELAAATGPVLARLRAEGEPAVAHLRRLGWLGRDGRLEPDGRPEFRDFRETQRPAAGSFPSKTTSTWG